jgi:protein-S-isoprenylcysteine O-methyltransferase Ste14
LEEGRVSLAEYFHSVATGPKRRRERLTPLGFLVFGSTLAVVIVGGLYTDRWLGLPPVLPGIVGTVAGVLFLITGGWLCGWCVVRFLKARGTPVPLNPPDELIVSGPYAWVRNPMLTGVFGALVGLGLLLHSLGLALIWTPAYAVVHMAELKRVEEPELARRFGAVYEDYRARVPMFIPRLRRYRAPGEPSDTRLEQTRRT